ncbi:MAG: YceI family protein [Pseudomonadota bacterium]
MKYVYGILVSLLFCIHTTASELIVSADEGVLGFAGEHAGMTFEGKFKEWQASLVLPPSISPKIIATFQLASAETGDSTYDSTLPEGDWFDVENHPTATFESETIEAVEGDEYRVTGTLSLRGKTLPVEFMLKNNGRALTAEFVIDRLAYDIGRESDPEAEWVSQSISMNLAIPL